MFADVDHDGLGRLLTPASPLDFSSEPRLPPRPSPRLGEHTDEILRDVLQFDEGRIAAIRQSGAVGEAAPKIAAE